nr:CrcB family protein [Microbacterium endophyticum]
MIAAAGGVGAGARFALDSFVTSRTSKYLPYGTVLINISGSAVLGFVVGLSISQVLPEAWAAVVATGFLGGYTTFSTASTQTVDLVRGRKFGAALIYSGGMFGGALAAAAGGVLLADAISY